MLGIWHRVDCMKRDLAQPIYGRVEHGSPEPGWYFHMFNKAKFLLILLSKCTIYYMALMDVQLLLFTSLYVSYKHGFMTCFSHSSFYVFTHN